MNTAQPIESPDRKEPDLNDRGGKCQPWASYNITDDRLRFFPDRRLTDSEYQHARACGFVFWHGQKIFTCVWRPGAEDFIRSLGLEIEADDTPDDVEQRVERFDRYAGKAQASAESAAEYRESGRANTERRRRFAVAREERELDAAAHWQRRIDASIRHAKFKNSLGTIDSRIKGLNTDLRREQKALESIAGFVVAWSAVKDRKGAVTVANYDHRHDIRAAYPCKHGPTFSVSPWDVLSHQTEEAAPWEHVRKLVLESHDRATAYHARWVAHLQDRLAYELALYKEVSGGAEWSPPERKKAVQPKGKAKTRDGVEIEPGGAVFISGYYAPKERPAVSNMDWVVVHKVNRTTIVYLNFSTVDTSSGPQKRYHAFKREAYNVHYTMTAAEVKEHRPDLLEIKAAVEAIEARNAERKKAAAADAESAKAEAAHP